MSDLQTAQSIAEQWLSKVTETVQHRDHAAHMDLISKKIHLIGVPGFDSIGYDDWAKQTRHEFENNLVNDIRYQGLKIRAATATRIMFSTYETVSANDGTQNQQGIECLLEKEDDDAWRLSQQRVMDEAETDQFLARLNT